MTISSQPLGTQLTVFEKNNLGVIIHLKNSETISINGAFSFQIDELTLAITLTKIYEETENKILYGLDNGERWFSYDPFYVYGAVYGFPQTWRHEGRTNCPDDWDAYDYQDGFCQLFTKQERINEPDHDHDGLMSISGVSYGEFYHMTNPLDPDSDNDWFLDGTEVNEQTNPLSSSSYPDYLGDSFGTATSLSFGSWKADYIRPSDEDWAKFSRSSWDTMRLQVYYITNTVIRIYLYSYSGGLVLRKSWTKSPGSSLSYSWDIQTGWGNQYYVYIAYASGGGTGNPGQYQVKVTFTLS